MGATYYRVTWLRTDLMGRLVEERAEHAYDPTADAAAVRLLGRGCVEFSGVYHEAVDGRATGRRMCRIVRVLV